MADIIKMNDRTYEGIAFCIDCRHEWLAVSEKHEWLECPECGLIKGRFKYQFEPHADPLWECLCGNNLFFATRAGYFCPNCGKWQKGF